MGKMVGEWEKTSLGKVLEGFLCTFIGTLTSVRYLRTYNMYHYQPWKVGRYVPAI